MKRIHFFIIGAILWHTAELGMADFRARQGEDKDILRLGCLNLNRQQFLKIRALKVSYLKEKEPFKIQLLNQRMALKLLWQQAKPDPRKIKALQKEIHALIWQLNLKETDYQLAFREVLTVEQLSRYIPCAHDHNRGTIGAVIEK